MSFFASAKMKTLISGKEWLPPLMGQGGGGGRRWVLRVVGAQAFAESEKKEEKRKQPRQNQEPKETSAGKG